MFTLRDRQRLGWASRRGTSGGLGPRLTTYTIMFLLFVAYFLLRSAMEDPARQALLVGLCHLRLSERADHVHVDSLVARFIRVDRRERQVRPSSGMMTVLHQPGMFTLLYVVLLIHRYRLEQTKEQVELLKEQLGISEGDGR